MNIVKVNINDLKFADYNPRKWSDEAIDNLKKSIQKFGIVDPIIVNKNKDRNNIIVGGHFRCKIAKDLEIQEVPVVYVDLDLEKERELNLRLNKNLGEWDYDALANFDKDLLKDVGWDDVFIDKMFFNLGMSEGKNKLREDFIIPPFSIFDSRLDYWLERKEQWEQLGIESEIGRDKNLLSMRNTTILSSIGFGTSVFNPVLCEIIYKWYRFI